jgi:hypothetical protein
LICSSVFADPERNDFFHYSSANCKASRNARPSFTIDFCRLDSRAVPNTSMLAKIELCVVTVIEMGPIQSGSRVDGRNKLVKILLGASLAAAAIQGRLRYGGITEYPKLGKQWLDARVLLEWVFEVFFFGGLSSRELPLRSMFSHNRSGQFDGKRTPICDTNLLLLNKLSY